MSKFTLIEVHLDGSSITANAPFSNASNASDADDAAPVEADTEDADDSGGFPVAPLVGLLVVVALAVAAKKLLSGEVPEDIELDAEADVDIE